MSRSICGVCMCPYGDEGDCACETKENGMNNYEQATQEVRDAFNALCQGRVEAAVKAEREACAKVCEEAAQAHERCAYDAYDGRYDWKADSARDCADAIRERSANAGARGQ